VTRNAFGHIPQFVDPPRRQLRISPRPDPRRWQRLWRKRDSRRLRKKWLETERAGVRDQMELFREGSINWQARRASVETHYRARMEDIEQSTRVPEPADPQPLGALLVLA